MRVAALPCLGCLVMSDNPSMGEGACGFWLLELRV